MVSKDTLYEVCILALIDMGMVVKPIVDFVETVKEVPRVPAKIMETLGEKTGENLGLGIVSSFYHARTGVKIFKETFGFN